MKKEFIAAFTNSMKDILSQFNITGFACTGVSQKESMNIFGDVTTFIGIVGDYRGNISYSFKDETAKKIISHMMMGAPVNEVDSIGRSALSELTNMLAARAVINLSSLNKKLDITPPTIIYGKDVSAVLGSVTAVMIKINSTVGEIEMNLGLEF